MNTLKLRAEIIQCLCVVALVALAPLDSARARGIVVDQGEFLDLNLGPACTIGLACAGTPLPFTFDFGGGATNQAYIYNSGIVSFGAQIPLGVDLSTTGFADFGVPVIAPLFDPSLPPPVYDVGVGVLDPSFFTFTPTLPSLGFTNPVLIEFLDAGIAPGFLTPATWLILDGSASEIRFEFVHGMSFDSDGPGGLPPDVALPSTTGRSLGYALGGKKLTISDPNPGGDFAFSITSPVPEPTAWAMLIVGFGMMGGALRRTRRSSRLSLLSPAGAR